MSSQPCPSGTYNGATGQFTLGQCITTPAGQYSLSTATAPTGYCAAGYYCPAGSSSATAFPCPVGTYNTNTGGGSQAACATCVAGGYCPQASVTPTVCPRGSYCTTGVTTPSPCPIGTYGNTTGLVASTYCIRFVFYSTILTCIVS